MEVMSLDDAPFTVSANYDRVLFPPRGRDGGGNGMNGTVTLASGAVLDGKGRQTVPRGDTLHINMPGGGGLGSAFERDPERVADDVRAGMVSADAAGNVYCVALREDGTCDRAATLALRRKRTPHASEPVE
jgi:N-methylhydantoinase B